MRAVNTRTTREPLDRRHTRLVHALLAFPAAGIIGFAGHAIVKSALSESPVVTAPAAPGRAIEEPSGSREQEAAEPESIDPNAARSV